MIVTSLWGQVDYQTKNLAPWQELRKGAASSDRSVLLDYISPMMHERLFASAKNKHWGVLASSIGLLLLQLAVRHLVVPITPHD